MDLFLTILISYLLGSIPFGLCLTQLFGLGDIRKIGSGNVGATNVLRTGNRKVAALTLFFDIAKGFLAVWIFSFFGNTYGLIAGCCAFLGHLFPIWLHFKGGKGVATWLGVLAAIAWPCAVIFVLIWLLVAVITRYSSLSAMIAVIIVDFCAFLWQPEATFIVIVFMSILIFLKHYRNMIRLLQGNESKIGKMHS